MKTTISISRKSSGSYFIGTPNNSKQELLIQSQKSTELAKFCTGISGRFIKAEYSRSMTYFGSDEIKTIEFWDKIISKKSKENYARAVSNLAWKIRRKTALILSKQRSEETIAAFTPAVAARFVKKWNEILKVKNDERKSKGFEPTFGITNKEANSLAWKKQNYLGIEKVDIFGLRSLLKQVINK